LLRGINSINIQGRTIVRPSIYKPSFIKMPTVVFCRTSFPDRWTTGRTDKAAPIFGEHNKTTIQLENINV